MATCDSLTPDSASPPPRPLRQGCSPYRGPPAPKYFLREDKALASWGDNELSEMDLGLPGKVPDTTSPPLPRVSLPASLQGPSRQTG